MWSLESTTFKSLNAVHDNPKAVCASLLTNALLLSVGSLPQTDLGTDCKAYELVVSYVVGTVELLDTSYFRNALGSPLQTS